MSRLKLAIPLRATHILTSQTQVLDRKEALLGYTYYTNLIQLNNGSDCRVGRSQLFHLQFMA
jgi:hypothetical protein